MLVVDSPNAESMRLDERTRVVARILAAYDAWFERRLWLGRLMFSDNDTVTLYGGAADQPLLQLPSLISAWPVIIIYCLPLLAAAAALPPGAMLLCITGLVFGCLVAFFSYDEVRTLQKLLGSPQRTCDVIERLLDDPQAFDCVYQRVPAPWSWLFMHKRALGLEPSALAAAWNLDWCINPPRFAFRWTWPALGLSIALALAESVIAMPALLQVQTGGLHEMLPVWLLAIFVIATPPLYVFSCDAWRRLAFVDYLIRLLCVRFSAEEQPRR